MLETVPHWQMEVEIRRAPFDRDEARRALAVFASAGPATHRELRGVPSGRSREIVGTDPEAALAAVAELADDRGVYVTLNPVRPGLGRRAARNADILAREWLLVDCDAVKATGKDASATDDEKAEAEAVCMLVRAALRDRLWPEPMVIDSGNGYHLLYRVELPNDKLAQQWVAACLRVLAARYSTAGAKIDKSVHNASRISKLPGTWVRKGPDTADRPHRMARILSVPERLEPVPTEAIGELARELAPQTGHDRGANGTPAAPVAADGTAGWEMTVAGPGGQYARAALEREAGKVATAAAGGRNTQLHESALKLGGYVAGGQLQRAAVEAALTAAARASGLEGEEIARAIKNGLEAGLETPKRAPEPRGRGKAAASPPIDAATPLVIQASTVRPRAVVWLWENRIPIGFVTVFAGRTGLGKSFVLCDLAARITQGEDLPDGRNADGECRNVLFISEDPYEFMLAPRLIELGADLDRVFFLRWEMMLRYSLADIGFLNQAWEQSGRPALIAIDPPTNFLGDMDEHRNSEVRQVLMGLVQWLADKPVAVVLITHVNKQAGKGIEAINRVIGSVAWTTASRVAHTFAIDPSDPSRCLFVPMKINIGRLAKGLAYRIVGTETLARVEWLGEVETSADEAMGGEARPPRQIVATDWLTARFRERREWPSDELFAAAKQEGISRNAVFEAKAKLSLPKARKDTLPNGDSVWVWWVPPNWPPLMPPPIDPGTPY
jgi:hypothetical protein